MYFNLFGGVLLDPRSCGRCRVCSEGTEPVRQTDGQPESMHGRDVSWARAAPVSPQGGAPLEGDTESLVGF